MQLLITTMGGKAVEIGGGLPVTDPGFGLVGVVVPPTRSAIERMVVQVMSAKPLQRPDRIMVMQFQRLSCTQPGTTLGVTDV